ncbi:7TM-DISM domain-containing protein, partial [Arcobacter sp. CECT 8985]|uniref:7TMR-DISMED2 domain-containing protein n=1 Tax=Arcobacter sp. CECT 8985 TaxID=1935424 RepID=UPI001026A26D
MIKKAIFLFFISFNYIIANTLILNDNTNYSDLISTSYQKTFIDKSAKLIIDDMVKNTSFKQISKSNYKASKNTIWTKLSIKNLSSKDLKLYFENNRPIIDIIDVYIFKDEKAYKKIELGENRDIKKRELQTRKSTFSLQVEKNSKYTIYIMYKSYTSISTFWKIENQYNYISSSTLESLSWGIFIGIIIT